MFNAIRDHRNRQSQDHSPSIRYAMSYLTQYIMPTCRTAPPAVTWQAYGLPSEIERKVALVFRAADTVLKEC